MTNIFVSYRREDSGYIAATITEKLGQSFGEESVYFDIDSVPLGVDFRKHIADSVGQCDVLLVIVGDNWIDSRDDQGNRRLDNPADFVRLEIESALTRSIPVVPVLVHKAQIPPSEELPSSLKELAFHNAAEVRAGHDLRQHLERLVSGIRALPLSTDSHNGESKDAQTRATTIDSEPSGDSSPSNKSIAKNSRTASKRWVLTTLTLILAIVAGWLAGFTFAEVLGYGDQGGWIGAIPTWIIGIVLTYKVWKRN